MTELKKIEQLLSSPPKDSNPFSPTPKVGSTLQLLDDNCLHAFKLRQNLFTEVGDIKKVLSDERKEKEEDTKDKWFKVLTAFEGFDEHMVKSAQDGINSLLTFVDIFFEFV